MAKCHKSRSQPGPFNKVEKSNKLYFHNYYGFVAVSPGRLIRLRLFPDYGDKEWKSVAVSPGRLIRLRMDNIMDYTVESVAVSPGRLIRLSASASTGYKSMDFFVSGQNAVSPLFAQQNAKVRKCENFEISKTPFFCI